MHLAGSSLNKLAENGRDAMVHRIGKCGLGDWLHALMREP